jgi:hypothetical protein
VLELIRGRVSSSPIGDTRLNSLVCWSHRYFDATDGSALDMEAADCPWAVMADWAVAPDDPVLSVIPGLLLRSHIKWWHNCRCAQNCGRQVFSTSWGFDALVRVRVRVSDPITGTPHDQLPWEKLVAQPPIFECGKKSARDHFRPLCVRLFEVVWARTSLCGFLGF